MERFKRVSSPPDEFAQFVADVESDLRWMAIGGARRTVASSSARSGVVTATTECRFFAGLEPVVPVARPVAARVAGRPAPDPATTWLQNPSHLDRVAAQKRS